MSLTKKWYQILNLLLVREYVPLEELSRRTAMSAQTVKKNIELLNEQMEGIATIDQHIQNYQLKIDQLDLFQEIMNGKLNQETDFNSFGRRMAYILKRFIIKDDFIIIDDLAEELGVSRGTVNKDVKLIKENISKYNTSIQGIPNKGLKLVGSEFQLRLLLLNFVYDYYSEEYFISAETLDQVDKLAKEYMLNQYTVNLFKKVIAVSLRRILGKNPILEPILYYNNFEKDSSKMEEFLFHIEKEYKLTLGSYDQDFLSFPINTRVTTTVIGNNMVQYEGRVRGLFHEMILEIKKNFITEIDEENLFQDMKYHLMFMLNRIIFHLNLFDVFTDEIQSKYPFSYELARVSISVLESRLMIEINEVELSYLAIYFELSLHKKKLGKNKKVAIVCSTGRGTAALIRRQLEEVLGQNIEIHQFSETDYSIVDISEYVAVFSTMPIATNDEVPLIRITSLFDRSLILKEWDRVYSGSLLKHKLIELSFNVLDHSKNYRENVKQMISESTRSGWLHPDFLQMWETREARQSTIFDAAIGFPHTINKGSDKIVISVGVFESTLMVEPNNVQIIFLMGIPEKLDPKTENILMRLYDVIFAIAQNHNYYNKICQLTTKEEFIQFIEKEGLI